MRRILMVAFHLPPLAVSSGIQRTLHFARKLPQFGWEPLILSCHPRAYERTNDDQMHELGSIRIIERAFALDSARHLSVRGRYPAFAARPDRWVSWYVGAVPKGAAMIRKYRPHAIWSTYPIATAHMIAHTLCRLSHLPWIADFRDPMAQEGYPADPKTWKSFKRIEEKAFRTAACSVFVTRGAAHVYQERYPDVPQTHTAVIENGYEEESFVEFDEFDRKSDPLVSGALTLLHSGVVYPSERDPTHFFQALRNMLDKGLLMPGKLRVRLRAPSHEAVLRTLIEAYRLQQTVELAPPLPYREALKEMMRADALLVIQASNCNQQIPAKVYEYLRCRRPVIALTDPSGDTAELLRRAGIDAIVRLDCAEEIELALRRFLDNVKAQKAVLPDDTFVREASRLNRTRELATLLDRLVPPS